MPLTFEDAGFSTKRHWQCFVCGKQYEEYQPYKEHILENHEEGREYLKCPDCDAPVRDMKSHYAVKHRNRIMPKGIQTRVVVWMDFKRQKDGKSKKGVRRPNPRRGTFISKKCNADFEYKSGLECEFFECLEADVDVESYAYEAIKIPYFWRTEWHDYIPDVRVNWVDGSTQIWEIKPANQTNYDQNKAKWIAANNYCANMGWEFIVLTEVGLGKFKSKLKKQKMLLEESDPEN